MLDIKRSSDFKIFAKLTAIIKPYQKLEFQKISQELEALDCLYSIQNKKSDESSNGQITYPKFETDRKTLSENQKRD